MYFANCATSDEIKAEYHKLAKANHPDLGGNTATMQTINTEYAFEINKAIRAEKPGKTEQEYTDLAEVNEVVRRAVEAIVNLPSITIEICGLWVWVSGNTIAVKGEIKAAGYRWASKKKMWYFAGVPASSFGKTDMDDIRSRYGSEVVKRGGPKSLSAA